MSHTSLKFLHPCSCSCQALGVLLPRAQPPALPKSTVTFVGGCFRLAPSSLSSPSRLCIWPSRRAQEIPSALGLCLNHRKTTLDKRWSSAATAKPPGPCFMASSYHCCSIRPGKAGRSRHRRWAGAGAMAGYSQPRSRQHTISRGHVFMFSCFPLTPEAVGCKKAVFPQSCQAGEGERRAAGWGTGERN